MSRWIRILAALCAAPLSMPSIACVNTYISTILVYKREGDEAAFAREVAAIEERYAQKPTIEYTNDLAVARILQGRNAEGIEILRALEKKSPGSAKVAANLGTALELSGQNEEALHWIREGIRRDPREHAGSEWVHVKVLEAKLAIAKDPAWLESHPVTGLDFGSGPEPQVPAVLPLDESGRPRTLNSMEDALIYQTFERSMFVNGPEPVLADLYFSEGSLQQLIARTDLEYVFRADGSYEIALDRGTVRRALAERRRAGLKSQIDAAIARARAGAAKDASEARVKAESARRDWIWGSAAILLALGIVAALMRRRKSLRKP